MAGQLSLSSMIMITPLIYTWLLVSCIHCRTTPTGVHSQEPLEDGILPQTHFAEFLRALYAPQSAKVDMSNDLFPLLSNNIEDELHEEELTEQEGPFSKGLVLQKRNARYCGSYLADALQMACSKTGYGLLFGKRSGSTDKNKVGNLPFISINKAHQFLSNRNMFHRNTRGVHDECCIKGCTFKELTSYCSRPVN